MKFAQIEAGVVVAIAEAEESPGEGWVECAAHVEAGWLYTGEAWRMQRYALVLGGVVANVIESAQDPDMEGEAWLACTDEVGPGWTYDGEAFAAPEPPPVRRWITRLAFRNRFTLAEKTRIELAAVHNHALAVDHASNLQAAAIRAQLADQRDATYIDLDRLDTRGGVQALEVGGLLDAAGRALQILDAPIEAHEGYRP
jgi:hypothetical protein